MPAVKKNKELTQEKLYNLYTDFYLLKLRKPNSVYEFACENNIDESNFYKFFTSFESLEKHYFVTMFEYTTELLKKNEAYNSYTSKDKLSALFFTFFEMATVNRSFVIAILKEHKNLLKNLAKLSKLREVFSDYVITILEKPIQIDNQQISKIQDQALKESAWLQFLSILNFWINDESSNFEKTDIFIEKSTRVGFDLIHNPANQSIIDFGKFLWKEKMGGLFSKS